MKRFSMLLCLGLGALAGLIYYFPLAWLAVIAMPEAVNNELRFVGRIWRGYIIDRRAVLPPISIDVDALKAISGQPFVTFTAHDQNFQFQGKATLGQLQDVHFTTHIEFFANHDGRFQGVAGDISLSLQRLDFDRALSQCLYAQGQVTSDALMQNTQKWRWQGPILEGEIRCTEGDLIFSISGQAPAQYVFANMRLDGNGTYNTKIRIQASVSALDSLLPLYGFELREQEYVLIETGRWR